MRQHCRVGGQFIISDTPHPPEACGLELPPPQGGREEKSQAPL